MGWVGLQERGGCRVGFWGQIGAYCPCEARLMLPDAETAGNAGRAASLQEQEPPSMAGPRVQLCHCCCCFIVPGPHAHCSTWPDILPGHHAYFTVSVSAVSYTREESLHAVPFPPCCCAAGKALAASTCGRYCMHWAAGMVFAAMACFIVVIAFAQAGVALQSHT
eukprot:scaffold262682_cov25-Tisochrysis_lutea.AAC.2